MTSTPTADHRIETGFFNRGEPAMEVIAAAMPSRITDWTAIEAAGYRAEIRTPGERLSDNEKALMRAEIRSRAVMPGVTLVFIEDEPS